MRPFTSTCTTITLVLRPIPASAMAAAPTFSAAFTSLLASSYFEAQRRQTRHQKITAKFSSPTDSSWQVSLPERLFGLSHLGLFEFDFFATSVPGQLLFVDAQHPMVTHGRVAAPGPDSAIQQLRAQFPDVPELHQSGIPGDDVVNHGVCSMAAVATGALFYYRCPNNAMPGSAVWILVKRAIAPSSLAAVPPALAALASPPPTFGSYDAIIDAHDAARPAGQAARLNEFRINLMNNLSLPFPDGVTMKQLVLGFLDKNGYQVRETPHTRDPQEPQRSDETLVDVIAMVGDAAGLTITFDSHGRLRNAQMTISADAYADDDYGL